MREICITPLSSHGVKKISSERHLLSRLMITAIRVKDSVSGIAKLEIENSGVAVLTDKVDELLLVVRVMDGG